MQQHSLRLIRYLTGNQCKDLRRGVICDKREVRVTIQATEFCTFASNEENTLEDLIKGYYNNQCGNVSRHLQT